MKNKMLKLLSLTLTLGILGSCSFFETETEGPVEEVVETEPSEDENAENTTKTGTEVNQDLAAWLPRVENKKYTYEGIGNEFAAFTWYPQFNQEDYYQVKSVNSGATISEIYEYHNDQIVRTFQYPATYFRDNFSDIGSFSDEKFKEIILQLPLVVGTNWTSNGTNFKITALNHEITVPAGRYETIEVTGTFDEGATLKRYYAEDIGLVAEIYDDNEFIVESNLESIEEDVAEIIPLDIYVADDQAMGMDVVVAEIELRTNDPARMALTALFTGQDPDYAEINILPQGTEIQYLFLNDDEVVEVDLSEEFESNMSAGSTGELFYIYNVVNTLSRYYETDEVLLTVDGDPFTGGHMLLQEGETLQFNEAMIN